MVSPKTSKCGNNCYAKLEECEKEPAILECAESACSDCNVYRQKLKQSKAPYARLMKKIISQNNRLFIENASSIALSFLAALVAFSRIADFSLKQLYLENVFAAMIYYLRYPEIKGASAIILGGHFYWGFAVTTKDKTLAVFIMTCLQVKSNGLKFFVWCQMLIHLFFSCIAGYFVEVRSVHYLSLLLYSFSVEYFSYFRSAGFLLEDVVYLLPITLLAAQYVSTEDDNLCRARETLLTAIIWVLIKTAKVFYTRS